MNREAEAAVTVSVSDCQNRFGFAPIDPTIVVLLVGALMPRNFGCNEKLDRIHVCSLRNIAGAVLCTTVTTGLQLVTYTARNIIYAR
jgi:hypothetical protein